ncbi:GNAT family N-acetyltransferase [Rubellicoccus peritrichatus]|uniref:GNAT family N-acetyltransferase n=1 Tax=Rubellicoccus peritrichatus TaxID=3080537 RepID=A0AAQ3QU68_9BACT|nr:GNAT family N-acetyltransferase [Puniceicoccus sp. CR14]WOO39675.1 GNAT family N-acetyltransferase [Puniceicoccus sp. CR14]
MITYRQIIEEDIPDLFSIRIATWDNENGAEELEALGINPKSVSDRLRLDHAGWIAFSDNVPVGFSMANRSTGELWVIAVLPEFEGQGIGKTLIHQAEAWLFSHGWETIWLTTSTDENYRAVGFYRHLGWSDWKIDIDRFMRKTNLRKSI